MTDDERKAIEDEFSRLEQVMMHGLQTLEDDVVKLQQRIHRLERSKMPISEALKLYEMLRRNIEPELTLSAFAERYALNYDSLRKARKRQKVPGVSGA